MYIQIYVYIPWEARRAQPIGPGGATQAHRDPLVNSCKLGGSGNAWGILWVLGWLWVLFCGGPWAGWEILGVRAPVCASRLSP